MSIALMTEVWQSDLPMTEKMVLLCLADYANDRGECWPAVETIAAKCSCTDRTVQKAIKALEERGALDINRVPGRPHKFRVVPRSTFTPEEYSPPKMSAKGVKDIHHRGEPRSPKPSKNHHEPPVTPSGVKRADPFPCPAYVDPIDWQALKANRKAKRAALTEGAHRQIVRKLDAWAGEGWPPGPIVAFAAERGWTTVFETDEMKAPRNGKTERSGPNAKPRNGIDAALDRRLGLDDTPGPLGRRDAGAGSGYSPSVPALPGPGRPPQF